MTPLWPAALPQFVLRDGYQEAPRNNIVAFEPDDGPPIERPKRSVPMTDLSIRMRMTSVQYDLFLDFARNDLAEGTASFLMAHPRRRTQVLVRLAGQPRWQAAPRGDHWLLSFDLVVIGGN